MNAALCLTTLIAVVCLSSATPEFKQRLVSSLSECMKKHGVQKEEVVALLKTDILPEDKEKQCIVGCYMDKLGYINDVTMDWVRFKADNPGKFEAPEAVEKANQVVDTCAKIVNKKEAGICELGVKTMNCLYEEGKKVQIQLPDFSFE